MNKLNKYGNISGGFIFDCLDVHSHKQAIELIGECVTVNASITYLNPHKEDAESYCSVDCYVVDGNKCIVTSSVQLGKVPVEPTDGLDDTVIAQGIFTFIKLK